MLFLTGFLLSVAVGGLVCTAAPVPIFGVSGVTLDDAGRRFATSVPKPTSNNKLAVHSVETRHTDQHLYNVNRVKQESIPCKAQQRYLPLELAHFGLDSSYSWAFVAFSAFSHDWPRPSTFQPPKCGGVIRNRRGTIFVFTCKLDHSLGQMNRPTDMTCPKNQAHL